MQGLLEARVELRPLLNTSHDRLKDLIFLDIALDSTVRTAIERVYEELNDSGPEVNRLLAKLFHYYGHYFSLENHYSLFGYNF